MRLPRLPISWPAVSLLLLPPLVYGQLDTFSLTEATNVASSLNIVTERLLHADTSANMLGQIDKDKVVLDEVEATDTALDGIVEFLETITESLKVSRDLIEATYLQPSTKKQCFLPNLVTTVAEQPADFQFNPTYGNISLEDCVIKSPESEDTLSPAFAAWAPTLMDIITPDSNLVWQYFGDALSGNFAQKPYNFWTGYDYDPRRRPWYTGSSLYGPKDFVLVLDIVEHDNFLQAREFISTFLGRLSGQDYVNIIAKNQVLLQSTCFHGHLARATPENVAELEKFLDDLGTLIFSDLAGAFDGAVDMVADTRAREAGSLCEASVIVLTDRQEIEAADVADMRAAVYKHSGGEVVDPDVAAASGQHVFVVHFVAEEVPEDPVLDALSCISSGVGLQASPSGGSLSVDYALYSIFDYFANAHRSAPQVVKWTQPYDDSQGVGLMVTATINCYVDGVFVGIMAADVGLGTFSSFVSSMATGSSYASLINLMGETIIHPLLDASSFIGTGEVFSRDISDFEPYAEFNTNVRPKIHRTTYGQRSVTVNKNVPAGDVEREGSDAVVDEITYAWRHIAGSPFILMFVVSEEDKEKHHFASGGVTPTSLIYENLSLYPADLSTEYGIATMENGMVTASKRGTFKFPPAAYVEEGGYLARIDTYEHVEMLNSFVHGGEEGKELFHKPDVFVGEVQAVSQIMVTWLAATPIPAYIYTMYVGSVNGVLYQLPGSYMDAPSYDPRKRPWYSRALANLEVVSVSTPYETATVGGGLVITVSKPLVATDTQELVGVAAVDMKYDTFVEFVKNSTTTCKSSETDFCIVIDRKALVVVHDSFSDGATGLDLVYLGDVEPGLAQHMKNEGLLVPESTEVLPANARFTTMSIDTQYTDGGYTFEREIQLAFCVGAKYKVTAVPNTNLFIVAVEGYVKRYGCLLAGLPPVEEIVNTDEACSAVETLDDNPDDVKSAIACPLFEVEKEMLEDLGGVEGHWTCPSVLDGEEAESAMYAVIRKLGVPGIVSIIAGFLTIVTTLVLFRIRFNAAHSQVKAAETQEEILKHIQGQNSGPNNQSVRKMSVGTLEKEGMRLEERASAIRSKLSESSGLEK